YARIKQLHEMDCSKFSAEDMYIFVKLRNKETKKLLGFTTFLIKPEYPQNSVKDMSIGVIPEAQGRGLGKLLISSIFKIIPTVKRIFLFTRVTNDNAIGAYKAWGFTKDLHPIQDPNFMFKKEHWESLEYKVENSDKLQKTVEQFNSVD
ncbi:GNAT family N-acetyltransferase, partial [Candidatus Dependentiae bacterium]